MRRLRCLLDGRLCRAAALGAFGRSLPARARLDAPVEVLHVGLGFADQLLA